ASDGVPGAVPDPRGREGHAADRAPQRRDRARHPGGHLRLGPAHLPRDDARHPRGPDVRPRVHRRGGRGGLVGAEPEAGRPRDGALQHLLRLLLLLLAKAVRQLPQREPQRHRRGRHLRVLAHHRRLRRRPGGVR
ncbi:MAG: Threonine dehydrogenase and related Zn-dependent dehydrogenases, partial [uncultured Gemmatimonadetes bacterium]